METHIKIVAIAHIVLAGMGLLVALLMLVVGLTTGAAIFFPAMEQGATPDAVAGLTFVSIAFIFIILIIGITSLPGLIGGFGLMNHANWARILIIIVSIFQLLSIPIGTAVGIYSLVVLLSPEASDIFSRKT